MNPVDGKYLIEFIERSGYDPRSNWEKKFLKDMKDLISQGKYLKGDQGPKLQELYRKSQDGGSRQQREYIR